MLADYHRHSTDFYEDDKQYMTNMSDALSHYKHAMELGIAHLPPTSPIFLALALNYSVFIYDMQNNVELAISTAEAAFHGAINQANTLSEEDHKESTLLLQLLRDNLQLWTTMVETDEDLRGDPGLTAEEPEIEPEPEP